jgi:uncharacterized protein YukJ
VLSGTLLRSLRDAPDSQGRWFHVNVFVSVAGVEYRCAAPQGSTALERILVPGKRVLVWGEPFTSGNGMYNIHQNQGDPAGSQWWAENAIWQDGGTLAEQPDGSWIAFINKFTSQSYRTDDQGHPLP